MVKKTIRHLKEVANSIKDGDNFARMTHLLHIADKTFENNPTLAKTYIGIMKDIAKKNSLRIDGKVKKFLCSKCNNLIYKDKKTKVEFKNLQGKKAVQFNCGDCEEVTKMIIF